jgi:hypothetical protein
MLRAGYFYRSSCAVISLIRGIIGLPLPLGVGVASAAARLYRRAFDTALAPSRKQAAVAAARVSAGVCGECGRLPIDRGGTCDDCWVDQHAGP